MCLSIGGGLGLEQGPCGLEVAGVRGVVQGGGPSVVGTGHVGIGRCCSCRQKGLHHRLVALLQSYLQCGEALLVL